MKLFVYNSQAQHQTHIKIRTPCNRLTINIYRRLRHNAVRSKQWAGENSKGKSHGCSISKYLKILPRSVPTSPLCSTSFHNYPVIRIAI